LKIVVARSLNEVGVRIGPVFFPHCLNEGANIGVVLIKAYSFIAWITPWKRK